MYTPNTQYEMRSADAAKDTHYNATVQVKPQYVRGSPIFEVERHSIIPDIVDLENLLHSTDQDPDPSGRDSRVPLLEDSI